MSYSSLSDNGILQIFSFFLNDYMELFKTVPAYSWLFVYYDFGDKSDLRTMNHFEFFWTKMLDFSSIMCVFWR